MPDNISSSKHDILLRTATAADADAAAEIAAEVFEGVSFDFLVEQRYGLLAGTSWQERKAAEVRNEVLSNPAWTLIAEVDGEVVGFVTTSMSEHPPVGHILNLAVAKKWQGHGIGKKLLEAAYRMLRERGARYLQIETLETNEVGKHLYPRLGFREIVRKIYYFMEVDEWAGPQ
ncbi:MAG: GNAT family N-acetyltransferase [Armatimonadetes bacterium]|nr:GNAT family N-acetyltransferase [Armatimonadota bacterium]